METLEIIVILLSICVLSVVIYIVVKQMKNNSPSPAAAAAPVIVVPGPPGPPGPVVVVPRPPAPQPNPPPPPPPPPRTRSLSPIKGFYLWSWTKYLRKDDGTHKDVILPSDYNMAISFTGWGTTDQSVDIERDVGDGEKVKETKNPLKNLLAEIPGDKPLVRCSNWSKENQFNFDIVGYNLLTVGGGAQTGDWTNEALNVSTWKNKIIPEAIRRGYNGFSFDIEEGRRTISSEATDVLDPLKFDPIFNLCRRNKMYIMASMSWFGVSRWGFDNVSDIRNYMIDRTARGMIDIYSPQVYDVKACGTPWDGKKEVISGKSETAGGISPEAQAAHSDDDVLPPEVVENLKALGPKLVFTVNDYGSVQMIKSRNFVFPNNGGYVMYCQEQGPINFTPCTPINPCRAQGRCRDIRKEEPTDAKGYVCDYDSIDTVQQNPGIRRVRI